LKLKLRFYLLNAYSIQLVHYGQSCSGWSLFAHRAGQFNQLYAFLFVV